MATDFIKNSNLGMGLSVDEEQTAVNKAARDSFTENSVQGGATGTPSTSASVDTSSTFWGDVLEMGTGMMGGSGASVPSAGSAPSGSAPQAFRASNGNIAQILKMFSPYK